MGTSPARLRIAAGLAVLASMVFAVGGQQALQAKSDAIDRARTESQDLKDLQTLRTRLVSTDAAAGIDVLLGPDQPVQRPIDYDVALQKPVINVVLAARQADDRYLLAAVNLGLSDYLGRVATARELARLGRPQAPQALAVAAGHLRADVLPKVAQVQGTSAGRLEDDADASAGGTATALALAALVVALLLGVQVWLSRRTRRLVNTGLLLGVLAVGATSAAAVTLSLRSDDRSQQVRSGPYTLARQLVEVRAQAFDARAVESLGVVTGDVAGAQDGWKQAMDRAAAALDAAERTATKDDATQIRSVRAKLLSGFHDPLWPSPQDEHYQGPQPPSYADVHARLLAAARAGNRTATRQIAVSPTVEGSPGSFEDVDSVSASLLDRQQQRADDGWAAADDNLLLAAWLCALAGAAAAVLAFAGLGPRLREYR